jgi:hypothetical protein
MAPKRTIAETSAPKVEATSETVAPKTLEVVEISAYKGIHLVRTYSKEVHGDDFMDKAKEFATQGYTLR